MKLSQNSAGQKTLIYETITCSACNGTGKVTRGIFCPLKGRPVNHFPGRKCPECGTKNRHNHEITRHEIVTCGTCNGTGKETEDKFHGLPAEIFHALPINIGQRKGKLIENLLGIGLVGGATDYGRMLKTLELKGEKEVISQIRAEYDGRQVIGFIRRGTENVLCDSLLVAVRGNDYSVYPIFA